MAVNGDATALPFPDASFDRVIASEVVEHIPDDGRGVRRTGARAQARRHVRRHGARVARRTHLLGVVRRLPRTQRTGRPRPHLHRTGAARRSCATRGSNPTSRAPRARTALAVLVAALRGGPAPADRSQPPRRRVPPAAVLGHRKAAASSSRSLDRVLNPLIGKSIVVYAHKPGHLARNLLVPRRTPHSRLLRCPPRPHDKGCCRCHRLSSPASSVRPSSPARSTRSRSGKSHRA